jgi:hypothetical protein
MSIFLLKKEGLQSDFLAVAYAVLT